MKRLVQVLLVPLIVGIGAYATAELLDSPGDQQGGGMEGPPGLPPWLSLTLQQQQKIAELRLAAMKKVAAHEAELKVKHTELEMLWLTEQPKRDALLKKLGEIDALHAKIREAFLDFELGVLKVLTPAQRQALGRHRGPGLFHGFGFGGWGGVGPGSQWGRGAGFWGAPHGGPFPGGCPLGRPGFGLRGGRGMGRMMSF